MKKTIALLMSLALCTACLSGFANTSEVFAQKSYTVDTAKVTKVNIDVRDRQIEVSPSSDDQIRIEYFESSKEYYDILVSQDQVLTMTAQSNKDWKDYIGKKPSAKYRKISLQLPDTLLTALELSTTNEDISIPSLTVGGDLSLTSNGGNIVFDKLNAKNAISLNAKNGNISGEIVGSYDDYIISCNVKKGESNLPVSKEKGTKTLTVSNNNGNVDIEFVNR